ADHIKMHGGFMPSNGAQTISITGSGANAIILDGGAATGGSNMSSPLQTITAGLPGQPGSITITGPTDNGAVNGLFARLAAPVTGQTINTSGSINISGGTATAQTTTSGINDATGGAQRITAASISLHGGMSGSGNAVGVLSTASGDQTIDVAGGSITVTAGSVGINNRAVITSNGNQTISGQPAIVLKGGDGGTGSITFNTQNNANIGVTVAGKTQSIDARNITINGGAGPDGFATITGPNQSITASEDVRLTGGVGSGLPVARIGGIGGQPGSATNLSLSARDVILTGGNAFGGEALLGSAPTGTAQSNTITVSTTGDVILNSGAAAGARIGTSANFATAAAGNIGVSADNGIQLNGAATAIRTTDSVSLTAKGGAGITESTNAYVQAGALNVVSSGPVN